MSGFYLYTPTNSENFQSAKSKTLGYDAWYRPKAVFDNSLHHGMFTYNIPVSKWKESVDTVEQTTFAYATSANGKLILATGTLDQKIKLNTFRNPRYEPNRGHLYSISAFLPNKDLNAERNFGIFTEEAGVMFRLTSAGLFAVRRTYITDAVVEHVELITVPECIDIEKGCTYDIQFQWRGVGNYFFFINNILVHVFNLLGTLAELSTFNPAAPIAFECINRGEAATIEAGCVDVTSEGGEDGGKTYGSIGTNSLSGSVLITGTGNIDFNIPILAVRNKDLIGGRINTRDVLALLATAYADQRSVFRVFATRDQTAITLNDQVWSDFGDAHIEKVVYKLNPNGSALSGTEMAFDPLKAELIFGARVDMDKSYATSALFEGRTEIYQTPDDIFIFTMHRENGSGVNVGITYEFAEAI